MNNQIEELRKKLDTPTIPKKLHETLVRQVEQLLLERALEDYQYSKRMVESGNTHMIRYYIKVY